VLRIRRLDGTVNVTTVACRIDTEEEQMIFAAGGLLPRMKQEFLETA
jgi:aconitase A